MRVNILEGDVFETIKNIPSCSIQCVVTSPPYYGLRDYGIDGQIGLEETPEKYIAKLVAVFREVRRVLKDDGVLWLNLGDSYTMGKTGRKDQDRNTRNTDGRNQENATLTGVPNGRERPLPNGYKPKDLLMIPARVALALQADGWWLRSEIVWHKPNPMPESVTDRPTKSHEMVYLLAKSARYYYDAEAIKEPALDTGGNGNFANRQGGARNTVISGGIGTKESHPYGNGRNRRDVWTVATKPYKEAHFATFPPALIEPCVLAGSREGDTVLDPFSGSGTTGEVAIKHGRNYIGCEINPEYIKLTWKRLSKVQTQFSV